MKKIITFAVAFIAVLIVSIKMYGQSDVPAPNYYCAYFDEHKRCYASVGTACYGVDADCNWLDEQDQPEDN